MHVSSDSPTTIIIFRTINASQNPSSKSFSNDLGKDLRHHLRTWLAENMEKRLKDHTITLSFSDTTDDGNFEVTMYYEATPTSNGTETAGT